MAQSVLSTRYCSRLLGPFGGAAVLAKVLLLATVGASLWFGSFDGLQTLIDDGRFSAITHSVTGRLLLVDIDEPSIKAVGSWPWSRAVHAQILDRLVDLGASDIAFDVDFSSPSPGDGDAALEAALERAGGSSILAALQQEITIRDGTRTLIESRPLPRFVAQGWEAAVNVQPDRDGAIRAMDRGKPFGAATLPSLATLIAAQSGRLNERYAIDFGIDVSQLAHVSVRDLLAGKVDPSLVRDHKVIVGATAVELRDIFEVPHYGFMPGSAVQAMAAESLMQGRELHPTTARQTLIFTLLALGAVVALTRRMSFGAAVACCLAAAGVSEACAFAVQSAWPIQPVTAPIHAGLLGLALIVTAEEGITRRLHLLQSRRNAGRLRTMLDRVFADSFSGVVIIDGEGHVRAASAAAATILRSDIDVAKSPSIADVLPLPLVGLARDALDRARAGRAETESSEVALVLPDRSTMLLECVITVSEFAAPARDTDPEAMERVLCLTFRDVTAERQAHAKLTEMARVDALSGLSNRSVLIEAVEERAVTKKDVCSGLIFFDVDRFKLVNDRLGHSAGDTLIRAVAEKLRAQIRPGDVAARLGGDEFAIVLDRSTRRELEAWAADLRHDLTGTYAIGTYQPFVSISVGLAIFENRTATDMMSVADAALYAAKGAGGNCVRLYDADMAKEAEAAACLAHDLRSAVDRGGFEVVYQRQVDAQSERIIGVEALVRWKHPERGYISPARFIPIAERTGLIEPIGALVLETACRDAAAWPEPIKVSVNLSAVQLARTTLADLILDTLEKTGLSPDRLDVELTESLLLDDDDMVSATLSRLRQVGIKVSLDDFGTGYSSLSYLNRFAIDKVKIDQSFVRNLETVPSAAAIIRAVVGLARDVGLRVNVEGVETVEQLLLVRQLGCDEIQGYVHGKPEPSTAIEASLLQQVVSPGRTGMAA